MSYSLLWLPDVLKAAGLKVAMQPGWENRGLGNVGRIYGVICHHTGTTDRRRNMPSLDVLIKGRSDLRGPLAQLGLARDGTYYVVAAGRCQHAGSGDWQGISSGNTNFIGIEAENTGNEPYPAVQLDAYQRGVAAILRHLGQGAEYCVGHKEWARNRKVDIKVDPKFDMHQFRAVVAGILNGSVLPPPPIPAAEPGGQGRPTLRRGAQGEWVAQLQHKLGTPADGQFGPKTEALVREFQRQKGLVPDGIVGPKTWQLL